MSRYGGSSHYGGDYDTGYSNYSRQSRSHSRAGAGFPYASTTPSGGIGYTTTYRSDYSPSSARSTDYISNTTHFDSGYGGSRRRARSASPRSRGNYWSDEGYTSGRLNAGSTEWQSNYAGDSSNERYGSRGLATAGNGYQSYHDYNDNYGGRNTPMRRARSLTGLNYSDCDCISGSASQKSYYGGYNRPTIASMRKSQNFLPLPPLRQHLDELYITDDGYRVTGIGDRDSHTPFYVGDDYEGRLLAPSRRRLWAAGRSGWEGARGAADFDYYDYIDKSREPGNYNYSKYYNSNPLYQTKLESRRPFSGYSSKNWNKEVDYGRDGSYGGIRTSNPGRYQSNYESGYNYNQSPGPAGYMDGYDNRGYGVNSEKQSYAW